MNSVFFFLFIVALTALVICFFFLFLYARAVKQADLHKQELAAKKYDAALLSVFEKQIGEHFSFKKIAESLISLLDDSIEHATASYLLVESKEKLIFGMVAEEEVCESFVDGVKERMVRSLSEVLGKDLYQMDVDESIVGNISLDARVEPVRSYFHIPLMVFGEVAGVFTIASPRNGLYTVEEVQSFYIATQKFLNAVSRIQGALGNEDSEHRKQEQEYKRRIYQIEVLKELGERIGYSLDLGRIIEIITGSVGQLLKYHIIAYVVQSNNKILFKCDIKDPVNHAFIHDIKGKMLESFSAMLGRTFKEDEIDESVSGAIFSEEMTEPVNSFFNLPLIIAGKPVGLITVASPTPGLYNEEDTSVLYTIANQASNAVTRLHDVLEREKGKLNSLVTSLNDGIVMFDPHWNVQVINTQARLLLSLSQEQEEVSLYDVLDKLSGKIDIRTMVEKAISSNVVIPPSVITLGKSILQVIILQVNDKENENLGAVVVFHDITEETEARKLIEQKATELESANTVIEEQKNRAESILRFLRSIGEGVFATNLDGNIIFMNDAAEAFAGKDFKSAGGKLFAQVFSFIDDEEQDHSMELMKAALREKKSIDFPDKIHLNVGMRKIPIAGTCAPIINEDGSITGSIMVFQDITKKRELEQMKENFLTVAAHQLRTPLGSMRWGIELLEGGDLGELPAQAKTVVDDLHKNSERVMTLVNDLLNVSNVEGKTEKVAFEECDLKSLVEESVEMYVEKAKEKNIHIDILPVKESVPKAYVVKKHISEAIGNLLSNGVRYGREGGFIKITIEKQADSIMLSIADNGIGIPDADKSKVFEKFFRAANAVRTFTDASGLGLSMVKSYIKESKGEISFESEENVGTTFTLKFPINLEIKK